MLFKAALQLSKIERATSLLMKSEYGHCFPWAMLKSGIIDESRLEQLFSTFRTCDQMRGVQFGLVQFQSCILGCLERIELAASPSTHREEKYRTGNGAKVKSALAAAFKHLSPIYEGLCK